MIFVIDDTIYCNKIIELSKKDVTIAEICKTSLAKVNKTMTIRKL